MEHRIILLILLALFLGLQLIYLANFVFIKTSNLGQEYLNMYKTTHQFYLFFNYFKKANNIINNCLGNTTGYYFNFKFLRHNPDVSSSSEGFLAIKDNKIDCFIFSDFVINSQNITSETKDFYYTEFNYTSFYINKTLLICYNAYIRDLFWISPNVTLNNNSNWKNTTKRKVICAREHIDYTTVKKNIKYVVLLALIESMVLGNFKSYPNGTYMALFTPKNKTFYYPIKVILSPGKMKIILKRYIEVNIYRNNSVTYDLVKSLALKKLKPFLAKTKIQNNARQALIYSGPNGIFVFLWPRFSKSFNKFFNNTTVTAVCRSKKNIENIKILGEGGWISLNF